MPVYTVMVIESEGFRHSHHLTATGRDEALVEGRHWLVQLNNRAPTYVAFLEDERGFSEIGQRPSGLNVPWVSK